MVSFPFTPIDSNPVTLFGAPITDFWQYKEGNWNNISNLITIDEMVGFAFFASETNLIREGTSLIEGIEPVKNLSTGWNILGNPFNQTIYWGDGILVDGIKLTNASDKIDLRAYVFDNVTEKYIPIFANYGTHAAVAPWSSFFVFARSNTALTFSTGTLIVPVPTSPGGLSSTPGEEFIVLTWAPVDGATGYNVYRSNIHSGPYDILTSMPIIQTTYNDTNVTIGTTYYYCVTFINETESDKSIEISASTFTPSFCGDGIKSGNEQCDDGNTSTEKCEYGQTSCTICDSSCNLVAGATAYCGDNIVNGSEQCDDGNAMTDNCEYGQPSCTVCDSTCNSGPGIRIFCGDGIVNGSEQCDDENVVTESCQYGNITCTVCDSICHSVPGATSYCGDDIVNGTEQCDDGNTNSCDGCSKFCITENGFYIEAVPSYIRTEISWCSVPDAFGYDVYVDPPLFVSKINPSTITETHYTLGGLTMNTSYSLQVKALDAFGDDSALSNIAALTTLKLSGIVECGRLISGYAGVGCVRSPRDCHPQPNYPERCRVTCAEYVKGATVTLSGTPLSQLTDDGGGFEFLNVPDDQDYVLFIVDDRGTPGDPKDDRTGHLNLVSGFCNVYDYVDLH